MASIRDRVALRDLWWIPRAARKFIARSAL